MEKKTMSKVEADVRHLLNAYTALERARAELYWAINNQIKAGEEPITILPADNVKTEILEDGNMVKLTVMDYPSRLRVAKRSEKERWVNNIAFALKKIKTEVSFDRMFVFVRFYFPIENTDVDNYDVKYIINGIKYSGLVPDDIYKYVSFGFDAAFSKNPKTEIFLIKYNKNFPEMLTKLLGNL